MPIGKKQRESLYDALCRVKDRRDSNRTFHIGSMLSIVVMAAMSGANSTKAIARFAKRLDMPQRKELYLPHAKSKSGVVAKHEYKVPCYVTMYNFLKTLDLDDFARKLTEWMAAQEGTLPRQLALDGKFVKEVIGIVSVVNAAQLGMFGMHTLVQTKRQWEHTSGLHKGERTPVETSYHASTIEIDRNHGVDFFANAVRMEWMIETGYHGKRDYAYCEDVRTRRGNGNIIGALMLARTPAFAFMAKRGIPNSQEFKEVLQSDRVLSLRMVVDAPPN